MSSQLSNILLAKYSPLSPQTHRCNLTILCSTHEFIRLIQSQLLDTMKHALNSQYMLKLNFASLAKLYNSFLLLKPHQDQQKARLLIFSFHVPEYLYLIKSFCLIFMKEYSCLLKQILATSLTATYKINLFPYFMMVNDFLFQSHFYPPILFQLFLKDHYQELINYFMSMEYQQVQEFQHSRKVQKLKSQISS